MSKKSLFIGAVASIITINSVFADTTVTSKTYVDTTRQATIPVTGTNASTPGSTVVTYTGTAGQIGERGIFNPETNFDYENNEVASGHEGDLVTADSIFPAVGGLYQQITGLGDQIDNFDNYISEQIEQATSLPTTGALDGRCEQWDETGYMDDEHCLLWRLTHRDVFGGDGVCSSDSDCASYCSCINGICGNCVEQ